MHDVVIIGAGPAGLSAALVLGRCQRRTLVLDDGHPRNAASPALHGYSRETARHLLNCGGSGGPKSLAIPRWKYARLGSSPSGRRLIISACKWRTVNPKLGAFFYWRRDVVMKFRTRPDFGGSMGGAFITVHFAMDGSIATELSFATDGDAAPSIWRSNCAPGAPTFIFVQTGLSSGPTRSWRCSQRRKCAMKTTRSLHWKGVNVCRPSALPIRRGFDATRYFSIRAVLNVRHYRNGSAARLMNPALCAAQDLELSALRVSSSLAMSREDCTWQFPQQPKAHTPPSI